MDRRIASIAMIVVALNVLALGCAQSFVAPAPLVDTTAITVVDGRGEEIRLARPAERIVTIPMPAASIVMAIDGSADRIVAMHPASKAAYEEGILKKIYPDAGRAAAGFVEGGFTPNVEEVLVLQPDVVFQWADRGNDLIEPMESAGIAVIGIEYGDQESLETVLRITGDVLDKTDKVERMITYHHDTRDTVAAAVADVPEDERPRVLYFLRYTDQLSVAGSGTYNDFYIDLAGGTNVAAGGPADFYDVTIEQILAWDPEVILLGGFDVATPADVYANEVLASVSAVQHRKVYKVPLGGYRWDPPSQESPLMWKWLAEVLHPDIVAYDLRADVRDLYAWMYGYDVTDSDIDDILRMPLNAESAGYERFSAE